MPVPLDAALAKAFAGGDVWPLVVILIGAEVMVLTLSRRLDLLRTALAGMTLALAAMLTGMHVPWLFPATLLLASLVCHIADIVPRWRR